MENNGKLTITSLMQAKSIFTSIVSPDNERNYSNIQEEMKWSALCEYLAREEYKLVYKGNTLFSFKEEFNDLQGFAYGRIRSWVIMYIYDGQNTGSVYWEDRRTLIFSLEFEKTNNLNPPVELIDSLNKITFDNNFDNINQNLNLIANAIEFFLKEGKRFNELNFSIDELVFIDNDKIRKLRNKLQCFRHSTNDDINEREAMTNEDKFFYLHLGYSYLTIIKKYVKHEEPNIPE